MLEGRCTQASGVERREWGECECTAMPRWSQARAPGILFHEPTPQTRPPALQSMHDLRRLDPRLLLLDWGDLRDPRHDETRERHLHSGVTDEEMEALDIADEDSALHGAWHWADDE